MYRSIGKSRIEEGDRQQARQPQQADEEDIKPIH